MVQIQNKDIEIVLNQPGSQNVENTHISDDKDREVVHLMKQQKSDLTTGK